MEDSRSFGTVGNFKTVTKGPDCLVDQILTVPTTINHEKLRPAVGSRPRSILTFWDLRLTGTLLG